MKLKKLLMATAVALAVPSAAQALTIANTTAGGAVTPATEANFANGAFGGPVSFTVVTTSGTPLPQGSPMKWTITLPAGMTFNGNVNLGTAVLAGADGQLGAVSSLTGGTNGTNSIEFLYTANNPADLGLAFLFNVATAGCSGINGGGLKVDVSIDASGTLVDGGTASTSTAAGNKLLNPCKEAYKVTYAPAGAVPTLTLGSGYRHFGAAVAAGAGDNVRPFGTYTVAVDTTVNRTFAAKAAAADMASLDFTVNATDGSVFNHVNIDAGAPNFAFSGNSAAVTGASVVPGAHSIDVTLKNTTAPKAAQPALTATGGALKFTPASGLSAKTITDGTISPLARQVASFGPFDWNSQENTNSIYRVTGLAPNSTTNMNVKLTNSGANGTYSGTVTADSTGEAILTSNSNFGLTIPSYNRSDVTFEFETNNTLDVDRLAIRNDQVFTFGGANLGGVGADD